MYEGRGDGASPLIDGFYEFLRAGK